MLLRLTPGAVRAGLCLGLSLAWTLAGTACVPEARGAPASEGRTVLVELFTSQGCSSCPAADALVRDLPRLGFDRRKVVPLTFHVDYWNQLGWPDPFSSPAFTARQQQYVEAGGLRAPGGTDAIRGPYTPQMIVDGAVHFSGRLKGVALAEIERARAAPVALDLTAVLTLEPDRARVKAHLSARQPWAARESWRVFVAVAAKEARTRVTRGENGGELLEEAAIVRALSDPARITLPAAGARDVEITVARPVDLPWSALELTVFVQSEATLHVAATRSLQALSQ
jgi:hypothetical protein